MSDRKRVLTIGALLVLGFAAGGAHAQDTFTFDTPNGLWQVPANWIGPPDEAPGTGDKAIILINQICRVEGQDEAAEIVQVDVGGTLVIDGRTLTIDTDGNGTNDTPKLTVNGQVRFEGTNATLVYGNAETGPHFVLDGAGTVLADGLPGPLTARG